MRCLLPWVIIVLTPLAGWAQEKVLFTEPFGEKLADGWTWVREDAKGWRLDKGALVMRTSMGSLWIKDNNNRNLLLRKAPDVKDDKLAVEVLVENEPTNGFEHGGLVWYYDDDNYVILVKEKLGKISVQLVSEKDGKPKVGFAEKPYEGKSIWLRLEVAGGKAIGRYRAAAKDEWVTLGQCDLPVRGEPKVGLITGYAPKNSEHFTRFSDFRMLEVKAAKPMGAGDHFQTLPMGTQKRTYLVHVPPQYDAKKPMPVVLVLHGAGANGLITAALTGMNKKADEAGFIAVYPDGNGIGPFLVWNISDFKAKPGESIKVPNDVAFIAGVLDDLAKNLSVDTKKVYATGISNGGMMCYKLASELSERIAAIAPVAGTMSSAKITAKRPMPIIHFHGTEDTLVPFDGLKNKVGKMFVKSVDETMQAWAEFDGCPQEPKTADLPNKVDDGTKVKRKVYGPGKEDAEVILYIIEGGGHTWPGRPAPSFLGRSSRNISANDLIWEFFAKYRLK